MRCTRETRSDRIASERFETRPRKVVTSTDGSGGYDEVFTKKRAFVYLPTATPLDNNIVGTRVINKQHYKTSKVCSYCAAAFLIKLNIPYSYIPGQFNILLRVGRYSGGYCARYCFVRSQRYAFCVVQFFFFFLMHAN